MNPPLPGTSLSDRQTRKATGQTASLAHKEWLAEVKRVESCSSLTHDGDHDFTPIFEYKPEKKEEQCFLVCKGDKSRSK